MTDREAAERSRRLLDSRPDCRHELIDQGPDPNLTGCTLLACFDCGIYLSIDRLGIIRDQGPIGSLPRA